MWRDLEVLAISRLTRMSRAAIPQLAGVFALSMLLASCSIPDPVTDSTTLKAISQAGTAVILFSLVPVQPNGSQGGCVQGLSITFTKRGSDGQIKRTDVNFGLGYFGIPRAHKELVLEPGDYELAEMRCSIANYNQSIHQTIRAPGDRAFGKFSVSAGEVIDIGRLYSIAVNMEFRAPTGSEYYLEVRPNPPEILAKFKEEHPDLAATLQTRLIATWAPLSQERKRQLCEAQKAHLAKGIYLGGTPESALCTVLASDAPARQNTTSSNGTIQ